MAKLRVTVMLQQNPEGGWMFAYSSPDPGVVTVVDGTTHINVPVGAHEVALTLEGSAVFIEHPLVWLSEGGEPRLIPSGVIARLDGATHLVLTVQNDNPGPKPVGFTFFLVVLTSGASGVGIFGSDPILIEEPPPG